MFGDYEAQRHWMEITNNLPVNEWYRNSSRNDLSYWGLDYPPLSAYHMFLNGQIAGYLNESFIALNSSRGLESYDHKVFMRSTVIVVDALIFFSAIVFYWKAMHASHRTITVSLLYPALILIDHGHFQYNCVSLGLTVWAVFFLMKERPCSASIVFTLALNYKQISMYHSLPFFFYLLSKCYNQTSLWQKFVHLFKISSVVIITFALCWIFFLWNVDDAVAVLRRLVPIDRGLFEDKVANVWCPLELVIKLRKHYDATTLFQLSALTTLAAAMPSSVHLFLRPSIRNLKYSLMQSSLAFFLFSFQVHEKGILLVGVAATLLLSDHPLLVSWFFVVSTFRSVANKNFAAETG
jgi:alpha-1,3-glucosyltransferase